MKSLKILISLVGLFLFFSFTNAYAIENTYLKDFKNYKKDVKKEFCNNYECFNENDIYLIYEFIKTDFNFKKKFKEEIKNFLKDTPQPGEFFGNVIYDREVACEYTKAQFLEDSFWHYVIYKMPECFDDEFVEKTEELNFIDNIYIVFKKLIYDVNKLGSISVKKYIGEMTAELKKFKINCMFKVENSKVVCCSNSVKGQCLAELVNYCISVLRFGEFVLENPELVDECFKYRKKVYLEKKDN